MYYSQSIEMFHPEFRIFCFPWMQYHLFHLFWPSNHHPSKIVIDNFKVFGADKLRDISVMLRDINVAYELLTLAKVIRPNGKFINQKLTELKSKITSNNDLSVNIRTKTKWVTLL